MAGQAVRRATVQGGIARGVGGFLRPFRRVGGILWLEVTGVFFLLPVIAFTPNLWRMRGSWAQGPDHRMFVITSLVVVVFLYLGVSSFWRARRK
jgi:type VI protein secretion system component VasK